MNYLVRNLTFLLLVLFCFQSAFTQETPKYLGGRDLTRVATQIPLSVDWQAAPLRERLMEFSNRQKIAVFLDRRVDGNQPIELEANNVSFEEFLWRVCDQRGLGLCRIEDTYYLGPRESAATLDSEYAKLKSIIKSSQNRKLKRKWSNVVLTKLPRLTEPKTAFNELCKSLSCTNQSPNALPHDLWNETAIHGSAVGQLLLTTAGFGMTIEVNDDLDQVTVIEMPTPRVLQREFTLDGKGKETAEEIRDAIPTVKVALNRRTLTVTGSPDELLEVHRILVANQQTQESALSKQRFTLTTMNSRGTILNSVAKNIGRKLNYNDDIVPILQGRVELEVENATLEELMKATLKDSGLRYRLTDDTLEVFRNPRP